MGMIENDWLEAVSGEFKKPYYRTLFEFVKEEYSRAVTDYIAASYPEEIMRSVAGEGKISEQISRITAYHLGWIDEIPETESFPELIR